MGQRGRKPASALTISAPVDGAVSLIRRPEPPLDLTPAQSDVWQSVVDAMPADWFQPETFPLLKQYCRHTVSASHIAQLIDQELSAKSIDLDELKKLNDMQARETSALKAMASSMRISQQSSRTDGASATAKKNRAVNRPWEG